MLRALALALALTMLFDARLMAQQPENLQAFLDQQLQANANPIVIPPGQYRLTPTNKQHLRLVGVKDRQIIADGVEIICTQTTRALTIERCANLTIRGLVIDYDPLPFVQARLTAISADRNTLDIEIFDGYPATIASPSKVEIFDPATGLLRTSTYFGLPLKQVEGNRWTLTKTANYASAGAKTYQHEQVGDIVIVNAQHQPDGSIPHALMASGCQNLVLENVTIYASPVFGFFETDCHASVYRQCRVMLRPVDQDLAPRGFRRLRSLNADAFHSKNAGVGPQYLQCVAEHQGDDSFAINGHYHFIAGSAGDTLRVLGKINGKLDLAAGAVVELVSYDGVRLPDAKVLAVTRDGSINEEEKQFLAQQQMHEPYKLARNALNDAWRVQLDRAVELPIGSVIADAGRIGNGFKIIGCQLGFNRARGIIVKASGGEIRDNVIAGCWGEAIKIAPEWWWLEAGSSNDLTLANNTITNCQWLGIAVYAINGNRQVAPAGAHRDIRITGNRISGGPAPAILVTSTVGLTLADNQLQTNSSRQILPWAAAPFGIQDAGGEPIKLIHVEQVQQ